MADVKWIKITTDIFDDEKILLIESLPDAYAIITCWFKLLCFAGKINNSGVFMMSNSIAYTDKMLSTIFRMRESTVQLALKTFREFGMIEIIDGVITIPNWDKHQSLDALEKKREYQKNLMRERRAKQKSICESNCDTNCDTNVSHLDKDKEIEIDIDKEKEVYIPIEASAKTSKHKYGEHQNVLLTDEEYVKLINRFPDADEKINELSNGIALYGYKYKSHYLAILKWAETRKTNNRPAKQDQGSNIFLSMAKEEGVF